MSVYLRIKKIKKTMRGKRLVLVFISLLLAVIMTGCGGIRINTQVFVNEKEYYTFTTDSGTYTYRIALEPREGSVSGILLGTTTRDSKLVIYRDDLPAVQPVTPGQPGTKAVESRIVSFAIKSGGNYVQNDSPDNGQTKFQIMIKITTDTEGPYLVDFKVNKQT